MSTLKELQDRFQRSILEPDDAILADIRDTSKEQRAVLFGVYRNAYGARLVEILQAEYPILYAYLGDEHFDEMGRRYLAKHPSRFKNARWFGGALPEFLSDPEDSHGHPELRELALIEKSLSDAFDAVDAEPFALADLMGFQPEDFPRLVFTPHPTVRRLTLNTNALAIWSALKNDEAPPHWNRLPEPAHALVWRQNMASHIRPLSAEEAMMWDEAVKGVRFGVLCELLATFSGPDEADAHAAGFLKGWIDSGVLGDVTAS